LKARTRVRPTFNLNLGLNENCQGEGNGMPACPQTEPFHSAGAAKNAGEDHCVRRNEQRRTTVGRSPQFHFERILKALLGTRISPSDSSVQNSKRWRNRGSQWGKKNLPNKRRLAK